MAEPSNDVLLTHIKYIRQQVDETRADVKTLTASVQAQDGRLTTVEKRSGMLTRWGTVGAVIGGLLSGFVGGRAAGG